MSRIRHGFGRLLQRLLRALYLERDTAPLERIGTRYGGWWCCSGVLRPGQVALCAGAGEDVSFDVALNAHYGMRVVCVDPTPRAVAHVGGLVRAATAGQEWAIEGGDERYQLTGFDPSRLELVATALWREDGSLRLYAPQDPTHVSHSALNLQRSDRHIEVQSRRLRTLLAERGVDELAILKLDIEGAEYAVLDDLLASGPRPMQVLVEFDELHLPLGPGALRRVGQRISALCAAGYALVGSEGANFTFLRRDALAVRR